MKLRISMGHGGPPPWPAILGLVLALSPLADCSLSLDGAGRQAQAAAPPAESTPPAENPPPADSTPPAEGEAIPAEGEGSREALFAKYMTGATLVGRFTIVGKANDEMPEEEYTILKCEKLPDGDLYRFTARIRYGETDAELPMDLPVYWAGDTPVISLTNLWIPGLGTFSSRVMIYRDRYSGTWNHGDVGGHLFGVIKKEEQPEEGQKDEEDQKDEEEQPAE